MNNQTTTRPENLLRGPERFAVVPTEEGRPTLLKALGAGAGLLALLVGVPVLLWLLTGPPPVPTGLPSREDLTQPLSVDALLVVLRGVVWLAWLQFAVCTGVELASLVRGGGLPRPVPLSGRSQALARALVGTLLVGTSFLGSSGAAQAAGTAATTSGPAQVTGSVTAQHAEADRHHHEAAGEVRHASPRMEHVPGVPAEMTDVIGRKVAVVQPPDGHYHDNLWDIAERHLGDGRRWKEIFELNQGRVQPDGEQLVLGRLIQPGWVLVMPEDATGVQRVHALGEAHHDRGTAGGQDGGSGAATDADATVEETGGTPVLPLVGGGLFAGILAGALVAERRRRRSAALAAAELEAEVALRVGADGERVAWLDRALRGLSAACRAERLPLPQVYAATVTEEAIELRVAPAAPSAPVPWSVLDSGRVWRLDRTADEPAELGHAPYPGLVCLGRDDAGADVLVDLESVGGILALGGSDTVAREVVSAVAVQLATVPWADEQVVHGYDLVPVLAGPGDGVRAVAEVDELVRDWAARSPRRDAQDVLTGRLGRHPGTAPQYLVLGSRPDDEDALGRLTSFVSGRSRGVGVVSAAPLPGARWRLRVDDSGRLSVPLLDIEVAAVRLTDEAADTVAELFAKARRSEPAVLDGARVPVPAPPRSGEDAHFRTAAVRVGVLGPVEVRAEGTLDPSRLELATELAVFLALQPAPVHPSVVGASVWPRGVTPEVRDATIARVRDWLGKDPDGNHLLQETAEGRLWLSEDVAVDWHAVCHLVQRSRENSAEEAELLRRALQLVRGELLAGRPALRYSWLPRTRLEQHAADVVVDAAHRLAELSFDHDPTGAAAACRAGLRLAPTSQVLWRDLLTAESRNPDGPGATPAAEEMVQVLHRERAPLEPETEALVAELLPGGSGAEGSA